MSTIKKYVIIVATVSAVLFLPSACTKEPPSDKPVITMTTLASEVSLYIGLKQGTESIVINWGDGKGSKTYETSCEYSDYCYFSVTYSYSSESEHHITIIGENIEYLKCTGSFLYAAGNQLTALDVSRNTALKKLVCGSSQLTTLDVSKNVALEYLELGGNQLTTLDVSNNVALEYLGCGYNQLTTLDVSKNRMLTHLNCSYNQLTTLDVSHNTELRFLYCQYNLLTASALNDLFRTMPKKSDLYAKHGRYPDFSYTIYIHENPGTNNCDVSIAQEKGWRVYPPERKDHGPQVHSIE